MIFCTLSLPGEGVLRPSCLPIRLHHRVCHVYEVSSNTDGYLTGVAVCASALPGERHLRSTSEPDGAHDAVHEAWLH